MRSRVEAAVAAGQTAEQIAERPDREGFRPPAGRTERFTPARARDLVYRLGRRTEFDPRNARRGRAAPNEPG
jgi:hypothetical protein